jgi:hypothetical protein
LGFTDATSNRAACRPGAGAVCSAITSADTLRGVALLAPATTGAAIAAAAMTVSANRLRGDSGRNV